jgi:hypothetical protein
VRKTIFIIAAVVLLPWSGLAILALGALWIKRLSLGSVGINGTRPFNISKGNTRLNFREGMCHGSGAL